MKIILSIFLHKVNISMEIILEHWIMNNMRKNLISNMKNYQSFSKIIAERLIISLEAANKKINLKKIQIILFCKNQNLEKNKLKLWVRRY
jgi:hypothetical protein